MLGSWGEEMRERTGLARQSDRGDSAGLLIAGVLVIGLGYLAWTYLGADLKRYLKIRSM
jgi:hypothetical protein